MRLNGYSFAHPKRQLGYSFSALRASNTGGVCIVAAVDESRNGHVALFAGRSVVGAQCGFL
jgi:hypothetical protein